MENKKSTRTVDIKGLSSISFFDSQKDNNPKLTQLDWETLKTLLTNHRERNEKDGPAWSPAFYPEGAKRGLKKQGKPDYPGPIAVSAAVGDFDRGTLPWNQLKKKLDKMSLSYIMHTTHSHSEEQPKYRVAIPLASPVSAEEWPEVWNRINVSLFEGENDTSTRDASRLFFLPSCTPGAARLTETNEDEALDVRDLPDTPKKRLAKKEKKKYVTDFEQNGAPIGQQRYSALSACRQYLNKGYSAEETTEKLWNGFQRCVQNPDDPWTIEEVEAIVEDLAAHPREEEEEYFPPYRETPYGLIWLKQTSDGETKVPLTNFTARISIDIEEDDGVEKRRLYEIESNLRERRYKFRIPAVQFASMNWPSEFMGAQAMLYPGFNSRDHARAAIQTLSGEVEEKRIFTHTGWRKIEEKWVYLHGRGAIGADGPRPDVEVCLRGQLERFSLDVSQTVEEERRAVQSSLRMLDVATKEVVFPLFASIWRTVIGDMDFGLFMVGPTGVGKTQLAALAQQHFGKGMDGTHLPGNWMSTANSMESLTFEAKDSLMVIDDFAPTGGKADIQRLNKEADRIFRGQANQSARGRMRADTTLRTPKPPRGFVVATGEETPSGLVSMQARMLILEVEKGTVDWDRLTPAQEDARYGLYSQALAGYIRWLAARYDWVKEETKRLRVEMRDRFSSVIKDTHLRTLGILADLALGMKWFTEYAVSIAAISEEEALTLRDTCWKTLEKMGAAQAKHQSEVEPTQRFLERLASALASGRAHVAALDGNKPENPEAWGWVRDSIGYRSQGPLIGWMDREELYLLTETAFSIAQNLARDGEESIGTSLRSLKKQLKAKNLLVTTEQRGGVERFEIRKVIQGVRRTVLHVKSSSLVEVEDMAQVAQMFQPIEIEVNPYEPAA